MAETYTMFLIGLVMVAVPGYFVSFVVGPLTLAKVAVLTRILASVTAAGLLSLAFVADALTSDTVGLADFFGDQTARDSLGMVLLLLAAGASGLLAALILTISSPTISDPTISNPTVSNPTVSRCRSFFAWLARCLLHWCAGCLVVATVAVLLLFPAVVVVILTASDLAQVP